MKGFDRRAPERGTRRTHRVLAPIVLALFGLHCGDEAAAGAHEERPAEAIAEPDDGPAPEIHMRPPLPSASEIERLPADGGDGFNRLVHESSPYLLQHARNPVDWYPWGDEAFERARDEDRPVFLSIGYSTCHWCHVMERESFEDADVAALLNEHFVCVKVDREERPDIDAVYMAVAQVMTGSGGWPLTVLLTPDRQPFYAGTYFPKQGVYGRPGMVELVPAIGRAWREDRAGVLESADKVTSILRQMSDGTEGERLGADTLDAAQRTLARTFDPAYGGFGTAPKFPSPHQLNFLLRHGQRSGEERSVEMVRATLDGMRQGGLFDHLGYGFHRYSTDARWLVPHFEKMLYDQAMLALAYLEAHQVTGDPAYAETAREIFSYVLRDMTAPEGGFYSAEDADSEGVEGRFYLWSEAEIREVLGEDQATLFSATYGVAEGGNYTDEAAGESTGHNILHLERPLAEVAASHGLPLPELERRLAASRAALLDRRGGRVRPQLDDKVLTDWNGLMIAALARGAVVLDEPRYAEAASRAADFCLTELRDDRGRLLKRYRAGHAGLPGHLDDHAFLVWGLLELYEATFETRYLREAIALNRIMLEHFGDPDGGGLFLTADDSEELLVRTREVYDGALPSGNSVAAMNLVRLGRITGDPAYAQAADGVLRAFTDTVARAPQHFAFLLMAADLAEGPSFEIVVAGERGAEDTELMLAALRRHYLPRSVVLFREEGADLPPIAVLAPFTEAQRAVEGKATAYVCREQACEAPTSDVDRMLVLLGVVDPGEGERGDPGPTPPE